MSPSIRLRYTPTSVSPSIRLRYTPTSSVAIYQATIYTYIKCQHLSGYDIHLHQVSPSIRLRYTPTSSVTIYQATIYTYIKCCLKECGLTTLETRRLRGDQIEVFKILNGYEIIDRNMFFSLKKDSRTRGHEVKLVKDQCRLDIRKHSFSQRTINEWNKLSTDCVTATSVNMFKNKVDTYIRRAGYK